MNRTFQPGVAGLKGAPVALYQSIAAAPRTGVWNWQPCASIVDR